jgi:TPP-dependent indolepyruvate ferredoxin oxidoreductase alpha subunit
MAMHSAAILAQENHELRAANEKQVQKRQKSKKQLPHAGSLTIEEGHQLLQAAQQADQAMEEAVRQEASEAPRRAPPRCSECHEIGHQRNQCPQRPI